MELVRRTKGIRVERFTKTAVPAENLAKLGQFLTALANLKMTGAVKPSPTVHAKGDTATSAEQSAEDISDQNVASPIAEAKHQASADVGA